MEKIIKWLKDNLGEDVEIITPQFERKEKLDFKYVPKTEKDFHNVIQTAPWEILFGMGFRKWDSMNNIIKENQASREVKIPIVNPEDIPPEERVDPAAAMQPTTGIKGNNFCVHVGWEETHPTKLLDEDELILMFPGEWYDVIPNGFMVTGLYGEEYPFEKNKSDDDIRFGCLPYGFRKKKSECSKFNK